MSRCFFAFFRVLSFLPALLSLLELKIAFLQFQVIHVWRAKQSHAVTASLSQTVHGVNIL